MKSRLLIMLAVGALALAACHSSRHTARTPQPADSMPAEQPVVRRTYTVVPFTAEVDGVSVSGQVRMAEDSVIWISVNKFIEAGRGMATADSLFLHAPMLGREEAIDYATLQRLTGLKTDLHSLQQTMLADDAEQRLAALAASLGFGARVRLGAKRQVDQLAFPFPKTYKTQQTPAQ